MYSSDDLLKLLTEFKDEPALKSAVSTYGSPDMCAAALNASETAAIISAIELCSGPLMRLTQNAVVFDAKLEEVQKCFERHYDRLHSSISRVRELQRDTGLLQSKLENKRATRDDLFKYIDNVLLTPNLIAAMTEGPVNAGYLTGVKSLASRIDLAAQPSMQQFPSAQESLTQMRQLYKVAVRRISDRLKDEVRMLRPKQANIAVLQSSLLRNCSLFYEFLRQRQPSFAAEIKRCYVMLARRKYVNQFETYLNALALLPRRKLGDASLVGGNRGSNASRSTVVTSFFEAVASVAAGTSQISNPSFSAGATGAFSIGDRGRVFDQLDHDPIVPVPQTEASEAQEFYFEEQIFRSHQRLLIDVATAEFVFLLEFFFGVKQHPPPPPAPAPPTDSGSAGNEEANQIADRTMTESGAAINQNDVLLHDIMEDSVSLVPLKASSSFRHWSVNKVKSLFDEVFLNALNLILAHLNTVCNSSEDPIGLLLMALLNEHNRTKVKKLHNPCLDWYLDQVQIIIWSRFAEHMENLMDSLKSNRLTDPSIHPHPVTKRYAFLVTALAQILAISRSQKLIVGDGILHPLEMLADAMDSWLHNASLCFGGVPTSANGVDTLLESRVFLINNYDAIVTTYTKRGLRADPGMKRFEKALEANIESYVALQFEQKFKYLRHQVDSRETSLSLSTTLNQFASEWKTQAHKLRAETVQHFSNLSLGGELLKRILMELVSNYSQLVQKHKKLLQKTPAEENPNGADAAMVQIISTDELLTEIANCCKIV